jgi:hypothetical protein
LRRGVLQKIIIHPPASFSLNEKEGALIKKKILNQKKKDLFP